MKTSFASTESSNQYLYLSISVFRPSYEDTLSDVLITIYEELNQALPDSLAGPLSVETDGLQSPLSQHQLSRPSSNISGVSSRDNK